MDKHVYEYTKPVKNRREMWECSIGNQYGYVLRIEKRTKAALMDWIRTHYPSATLQK